MSCFGSVEGEGGETEEEKKNKTTILMRTKKRTKTMTPGKDYFVLKMVELIGNVKLLH